MGPEHVGRMACAQGERACEPRAAVARLVREDEDIRAAIVNSSITIKALRFKAATALGKPAEVGARARRRAISAALTVRVRRAFAGLEGV